MLQSFISLILLTVPSFSWAAPAVAPPTTIQGFDSYTQSAEGIRFSCKKQCFVVLGSLGINDYLSWSGKISGSGSVGYGFLNGQQIIPGEFRPISSGMTMRDRMIFSHNQYYSQIPKEMPIVAVMNGEMEASDFSFILGELTPSEAVT